MKTQQAMAKHIMKLGLLLTMGVSMSAEAGIFGLFNGTSWKEEVLLHDGKKLIVERSQTYGNYAEPASQERSLSEEKWVFQIPGSGQKITWKSDFRKPPEGDSLMLLLLDFHNGVPYVATSPAGCLAYNHWGRPNPPYVFFKYDGKTWQRISLAEFPPAFKASNVAVGRPDPDHRTGLLSVDTIKEENRQLEAYLRVIAREPLASSQLCPPELTGFKAPYPIPPKGSTGSAK
ncbi:MAG: hypothetical protein ACYC2R_16220 [Burkholderiales bacterium]